MAHSVLQKGVDRRKPPSPQPTSPPSLFYPVLCLSSLDTTPAHAVTQRLDRQLLACVQDEELSPGQQDKLIAWAHRHVLSTCIATYFVAHPLTAAGPASPQPIRPCCSNIEMITRMLQGDIPLGADHVFACPPTDCSRADALARKLPAWLRRRVVLAAQRTRLHTAKELALLWKAVEAHLLGGAIVWLEFTSWLDRVDLPDEEVIHAAMLGCLQVVRGQRGIAWTPAGAVL